MAGGVHCEGKFASSKVGKRRLIAEMGRWEGVAEGLYYGWSKGSLGAGKRSLAGEMAWAATNNEVKGLRRSALYLFAVKFLQ